MLRQVPDIRPAVRDVVMNRTFALISPHFQSFETHTWFAWFHGILVPVLPSFNSIMLKIATANISCINYHVMWVCITQTDSTPRLRCTKCVRGTGHEHVSLTFAEWAGQVELPLKCRWMSEQKLHKFCCTSCGELLARPMDQVGLIKQTLPPIGLFRLDHQYHRWLNYLKCTQWQRRQHLTYSIPVYWKEQLCVLPFSHAHGHLYLLACRQGIRNDTEWLEDNLGPFSEHTTFSDLKEFNISGVNHTLDSRSSFQVQHNDWNPLVQVSSWEKTWQFIA